MKLHRPIAQQILTALQQTFGEGYYADRVIERLFKSNRQLGSRDRRMIAESVYEIVRWWRLLWCALGRNEPSLQDADLWKLIGAWLLLNDPSAELPPWPEFKGLDPSVLERNLENARRHPAIRESVPDWMYDLGKSELGEKWDGMLEALNRQAPVVLRANTLKTTREALLKNLEAEGIEAVPAPETGDGLILSQRRNIFTTEAFKEGLFEVQDGASQQVAPLLKVEPGQRVIDACAGAGGKTLHLAALLKNKGKIIAMDLYERKLQELRRRAARAGVDVVEVKTIESSKTIKRLEKTADRLLLDVPCSGMGVLRRNPDSKWKLQPEEIEELKKTQAEILRSYSEMVKPGGRLVYATCSILPSENERQVEAFLKDHGNEWSLVEEHKFIPGENGYDGFYAAALERKS